MAEIVNLRQKRKQAERAAKETEAAANRATFGRAKDEKRLTAAERAKAERALDQRKLDPDR